MLLGGDENYIRFEIFKAVKFRYQYFKEVTSTLEMEAAGSSETSVIAEAIYY
jgi:hypothetical protein